MALRRPSVRLRVALLVLVPLAFLIAMFGYTVGTSITSALALTRSKTMMDQLAAPTASLQRALAAERAQVVVYYARPSPARLADLNALAAGTSRAVTAFRSAAQSPSVQQSASPAGRKAITRLLDGVAQLTALRAGLPGRTASVHTLFTAYSDTLAASYQVLEQAILQEGNSSQVLPGIAVIELAISDEYLQQESSLLNGDFTAHAFPAADHRAFASLVGAHRLLYAQSLAYLTPADRAALQRDVSPRLAGKLTALENRVVAGNPASGPPPVAAGTWNRTVSSFNTQVQHAAGQAEARLAAGARAQADAKIRTLLLTGALGLAGVLVSIAVSVWLASGLTRRLSRLRDSALELANVHLPGVVQRLRAGEDVDVASVAPALDPHEDEIGQVNAAFNAARQTAVQAAVDEAKLRRGISQVFRNLAKRNQSLLHRQMALLDVLEKREDDPDNLESLFRLDHLTTRMRRHAESLVVLAGDTPKRGWRNPVPFVDVLRAATAEVEDYTRIKVLTSAGVSLAGPAVADVIHLVAELAENATIYSPRANQVRVIGELVAHGFAIEIEDRGLGLNDEELAELNSRLSDPPAFDLSDSDQLGIFVAAQLARRHGIRASLTRSPYGGVSAVVLIPMDLVVASAESGPPSEPDGPGGEFRPLRRARREPVNGHRLAVTGGESGDLPPGGGRLAALVPGGALPPGPGSAEPLAPPGGREPGADTAAPAWPPAGSTGPPWPPADTAPPWPPAGTAGAGWPPAGAPGGPAPGDPGPDGDFTENGLPVRVPRASLAPQLRTAPAGGPPAAGPPAAGQALRDPEAARSVMSAFRRGWREGLADPRTAPEPDANPAQEGPPQQ